MIKKTFIGLALPILILLFPQSTEEVTYDFVEEEVTSCGRPNTTFAAGEEITFSLQYKWGIMNVKAGEATFKVEDLGDTYRFSASGKTSSGIEWFYKVRDYYETIVDKETLLPLQAKKSLTEGGYQLYEKVEFDHEEGIATIHRGKTADNLKSDVMPLESCMYDIMSILYTSRNIAFNELADGSVMPIRFFMDKKIYPIQVIYEGKEPKKRVKGNGVHDTIKFRPQLVKNSLFPDGGEMSIWLTDDKNKMPLLIESPLSVGRVRAVLKSYKGLKSPVGSK